MQILQKEQRSEWCKYAPSSENKCVGGISDFTATSPDTFASCSISVHDQRTPRLTIHYSIPCMSILSLVATPEVATCALVDLSGTECCSGGVVSRFPDASARETSPSPDTVIDS